MSDTKLEEGVYLRKDKFGYRLIYPWKKADGTINWFNAMTGGSWIKLAFIIFFVLAVLGPIAIYRFTIVAQLKDMAECAIKMGCYPCFEWDLIINISEEKIKRGVIGDDK